MTKIQQFAIGVHLAIEAQRGEAHFKAADPARRNYAMQMLDELEDEFRGIAKKHGIKLREPEQ